MVDYNNFAKTFAKSREWMKWQEIEYFLSFLSLSWKNILDVWCGSWRLYERLTETWGDFSYTWVDLSKWLLDEAKKAHPEASFREMNMLEIWSLEKKYDIVFFIASFHHLQTLEEREKLMKSLKNILSEDGIVLMTNWALNSDLNKERYEKMKILDSENEFGSTDYSVKIGENTRYYHAFTIKELDYLFKNFRVEENRLFDNGRNYISIIKL